MIASCLNPAGPQLLVQVASFGGNPALEKIVEWGPLVIKSLGGVLFFVFAAGDLLRDSAKFPAVSGWRSGSANNFRIILTDFVANVGLVVDPLALGFGAHTC